jgi:hypothetical protein
MQNFFLPVRTVLHDSKIDSSRRVFVVAKRMPGGEPAVENVSVNWK